MVVVTHVIIPYNASKEPTTQKPEQIAEKSKATKMYATT